MDIVLLCAGSSSRMGKTNKLLLPYKNTTLVTNAAMQALRYIEEKDDGSTLVIVTGYRRLSTLKALKPCKDFIEKTNSRLKAVVICNKNYKKGQFSSILTGVKQLAGDRPFFIALADMPFITKDHYKELEDKLENYDAVRIESNGIPGHPVLLSAAMKDIILKSKTNTKMSTVLERCNVKMIEKNDKSWITDIDTPSDVTNL